MPYCIYLRKSRADSEEFTVSPEEVLSRHERTLNDLAEQRGYDIAKIFREVVSGETISQRPQMQILLKEVEAGLYDGVLVMEIERLARGNSIDQGIVSQTFSISNTLIITPAKIYNPENELDEEYFEFGLFMSRREYKTINRRLNAGRLASCREGKFVCGTAPYGYKKVKIEKGKGYKLEIVPEQAEIVKKVYQMYLSDEEKTGFAGIANKLNQCGISSQSDSEWTSAKVKYMLTNDVYIGKIHWQRNKQIKISENGNIVKKRAMQSDYYIFDGLHEPIIDDVTFLKVKKLIDGRKHKLPANKPIQNPFAGVLVCSQCGKKMKRRIPDKRRGNRTDKLECPTHNCPTVSAPLYLVEEKVLKGLRLWLDEYEIAGGCKEVTPIKNTEEIQSCQNKINMLKSQLDKTYTLLEQGIYDVRTYRERQSTIKSNIMSLSETIDRLKEEDKINKQRIDYQNKLIPAAKKLLEVYNYLPDAQTKNKFLKEIFHEIRYTKTTAGNKWHPDIVDDFELEFITKLPLD